MNLVDASYTTTATASVDLSRAYEADVEPASIAKIKGHIALGKMMVHSEIVRIDPEAAAWLLERNENNRSVNGIALTQYARQMSAGTFNSVNGQTIVVSKEGYLNDGQTRLAAVIKSGVSLNFMIVFGVERESRFTLDQGRVRTSGAFAKMAGVKHYNHAAAAAKAILLYDRDLLRVHGKTTRSPSNSEIVDFIRNNEEKIEQALIFSMSQDARTVMSIPVFSACYFIIDRAVHDKAAHLSFFNSLAHGESLSGKNPILQARNKLIRERKVRNGGDFSGKLETVIRAWNMHRAGLESSFIRLTGNIPEVAA